MALTINLKSYDFDTTVSRDAVQYDGPANTLSVKDILAVRRSKSAATDTFGGMGRAGVKLTRTLTDGTDAVGEAIVEITAAFPVDSATAEQQAMLDDLGAWLDGAEATGIFLNHDINQ